MTDSETIFDYRMKVGMPYSQATAESSHPGFQCRHHPDELQGALVTEGLA
jgi:hypothetical protein